MSSDRFSLKGKGALVTGSTRGIGKAIAKVFAEHGASVMLNGRNENRLKATLNEFRDKEWHVEGVAGDVASQEFIRSLVKKTVQVFGRLDIVVNNAGIGSQKKIEEISEEEWRYFIDVNLTGMLHLYKEVVPIMKGQKSGTIITMISSPPVISPKRADYNFAKAGVAALVQGLAKEIGPYNITINAISPSFINTELMQEIWKSIGSDITKIHNQIPLNRLGTPEEVAYLALFLASDCARFITGQTISINGGMM